MEKQKITEEMKEHEKWYEEARHMTAEKLPLFIKKLTENYEHDYGTICHAVTAAAIAAAHAVDRSPTGGITGFQASCIMWEFIRNWMRYDSPLRLVSYDNMLYPQYEQMFQKTISSDTAKWIREKAQENLKKHTTAADRVLKHWKKLAAGEIPFGYTVDNDM